MDASAFKEPNGKLIRNKENQLAFLPSMLPPKFEYDEVLIALISEANIQLGRLSGIGTLLPNPHILIRPYIFREAVLSSKIEGTQASILDVFRLQAGGAEKPKEREEKRTLEVMNYIRALDDNLKLVKQGADISSAMILNAHKTLMHNVRGQALEPGKFRIVQNWIGIEGTKIEDATYVPPPVEHIRPLLSDLEKFIQKPPGVIPVLIQCAIMHYQFEAIHPFADGNGRIGRLLIPLILAQRRLLEQPLLYLSAYIERNKTRYYRHLLQVSQESKWTEWFKFFLTAVIAQSRDAADNIQKLMALRSKYEDLLRAKHASGSSILLTQFLFSNPLITINAASRFLKMTYPAAKKAIEQLVQLDIMKEEDLRQRNKMYIAHEILDLLR